jgi:hypothetical protein
MCIDSNQANYNVTKIYQYCARKGFTVVVYQNEFNRNFAFFLDKGIPILQTGYYLKEANVTFSDLNKRSTISFNRAEVPGYNVLSQASQF